MARHNGSSLNTKWTRRLIDEALAAGADEAFVQPGGKHPHLVVVVGGISRKALVSCTPVRGHTEKRTIASIRRTVRAAAEGV